MNHIPDRWQISLMSAIVLMLAVMLGMLAGGQAALAWSPPAGENVIVENGRSFSGRSTNGAERPMLTLINTNAIRVNAPPAGAIFFSIANTEMMRIANNGRVGIGITVPDIRTKLHVYNQDTTAGSTAIVGNITGDNTSCVSGVHTTGGNWDSLGTLGYRSPDGHALGVYGKNFQLNCYGYLAGYSQDGTNGIGAWGINENCGNYGGLGLVEAGVVGHNEMTSTDGVLGHPQAGVFGSTDNASCWAGQFYGNVHITDNLTVIGAKQFVMQDPDDPAMSIHYACLEGPEAGTYLRGTAEVKDGAAVIILPEHFAKVTAAGGLTVQLTPAGKWLQLYTVEKTTSRVVVGEASGQSGSFDYVINGVRKGYENFQVMRSSDLSQAGKMLIDIR